LGLGLGLELGLVRVLMFRPRNSCRTLDTKTSVDTAVWFSFRKAFLKCWETQQGEH